METLKDVVPLDPGPLFKRSYLKEHGAPAFVILEVAKKMHKHLIVLRARGAKKHRSAATQFSDSIAIAVVANAGSPVLTPHS